MTNHTPTTHGSANASVLIKIRVNTMRAAKLIDAGIPEKERQDGLIRVNQRQEAEKMGRNPYRLDRTDATGVKRPDSGVQTFGKSGLQNASVTKLVADLESSGHALTGTHLFQKTGERNNMWTLVLEFSKDGAPTTLGAIAEQLVTELLGRVYEFCHVWQNPEPNPSTVNLAGPQENLRGQVEELHMTPEGMFVARPATSMTI